MKDFFKTTGLAMLCLSFFVAIGFLVCRAEERAKARIEIVEVSGHLYISKVNTGHIVHAEHCPCKH